MPVASLFARRRDAPAASPPDPDKLRARRLGPAAAHGVQGCAVLHGFTGSPWDVLPVASGLAAAGRAVEVPVFTGHDAGPEGVRAARLSDWRADVDAVLDQLVTATGAPVMLCGLSMGALLALDAAMRRPDDVVGVASLAAPLWLSSLALGLAEMAVKAPHPAGRDFIWPKLGGSDISTKELLPGPAGIPARALHELGQLVSSVRDGLSRVRQPLLVMHAQQDHTAPPKGAWALANAARGPYVKLVVLSEGFHVITRDRCMKRVVAEVVSFAARVAGG